MSTTKGRIKRSPLLTLPLGGRVGLLREIGAVIDHGTMIEAWATGLRDRQLRIHDPKGELNDENTSIRCFIYDEATEGQFASLETRQNSSNLFSIRNLVSEPNSDKLMPHKDKLCTPSMTTSISASPARIALAITKGRELPASMFIKDLDDDSSFSLLGSSRNPTIYWASAANPCPDCCKFAIATASGGMVLQGGQGRWIVEFPQGQGDIVAVDWLSPTVVITGSQLGEVRLWDTRIRAASREPRIQHPITSNHVRSIGESVIVVAGLQNELCAYDLRYSPRASPVHATQYYTRFPTYRNTYSNHLSLGFDVHQNLIAAATDDGRVQIFDVKKGIELKSGMQALGANASCVKFVDEKRSTNGLKLMLAAGPHFHEWAFGNPEEEGGIRESR